MRFRRLMFGLIPPRFTTPQEEEDYVAKFKRLSDYLCKLREADKAALDVKIVTSADSAPNLFETKNITGVDSMRKSAIQLRKGKKESFEWIELATDSEFSTSKSYRIMYNWLAASSNKVDNQVQLLHRRCIQYGLSLHVFPQTSISRDLLLNPVRVPALDVWFSLLWLSLCPDSWLSLSNLLSLLFLLFVFALVQLPPYFLRPGRRQSEAFVHVAFGFGFCQRWRFLHANKTNFRVHRKRRRIRLWEASQHGCSPVCPSLWSFLCPLDTRPPRLGHCGCHPERTAHKKGRGETPPTFQASVSGPCPSLWRTGKRRR